MNQQEPISKEKKFIESEAIADPINQFKVWFKDAKVHSVYDATAMTLATATPDGAPSARMVLLKSVDEAGFSFYTNFESRKAKELDENPRASLVFWWGGLERQVRVEGAIEHVSAVEADAYFKTRHLGSRLGAWASPQSKVIASREELDEAYKKTESECKDGDIPRPPFWGGYRVVPQ
ncbi:pyridoxamine 5'-phosphate oxidase, partial [bacterium]|nr:pyridoxamine 5'-phosphate oxidase [bacterium]